MKTEPKLTIKVDGWRGGMLWNAEKDPLKQRTLFVLALNVVLGLRSLVQVARDAWR